MELFNKYKNKNFAFLTNYINSCINDESLALTPEQLQSLLSGSSQSTFEEFILALSNQNTNADEYNASLLYECEGAMLPLRQVQVPIRTTIAEKAWLFYILHNSKADLFLDFELKKSLINSLEKDICSRTYPIQSQYIDIRDLSPENRMSITTELIVIFKAIVNAIRLHKYIRVTNNTFSGHTYYQQKIIPYKLEYSSQFDSFSLSCYPLDVKRPVKMNLKNISEVIVEESIGNYNDFIRKFEDQLEQTKEKDPVKIEIINKAEAYDRCAYLFSSYNTFCYDLGDEKLQMNIYYYRFQQEEIVQNILFLGHYVKVLYPKNIVDDVISTITASYENYE